MNHLQGQHAVVTGASRGIGAQIARALAGAGAKVSLFARSQTSLEDLAAQLERAHAVACDVADEASVRQAFSAAIARSGPVDILVNNAGRAYVAVAHKTVLGDWENVMRVNVTGAFLCTREVLPSMLDRSRGRIVNISSSAGLRGYTRMSAYCASKHALVGFTRAVALETAGKGVTVNAVCPTYTESDMTREGIEAIQARLHVSAEGAQSQLTKQIPLGRMVTSAEIASAVLWLCSTEAAAVTGIALPIAGGEVM